MTQYASERFKKLSKEKQSVVLEAAVKELARHGYEHANTNRIAKAAGISVGSLFQYFESKKNLFLHIIAIGSKKIESYVQEIVASSLTTEEKLRGLLLLILKSSREEEEYVRIYQELSAIGNKEMISPLALHLESYTAKAYEELLSTGVQKGEVRPDINIRLSAFHLDNVFLSLQYAYACDYYKERYRIYVSQSITQPDYDAFVVEETMKILRGAFLTGACR